MDAADIALREIEEGPKDYILATVDPERGPLKPTKLVGVPLEGFAIL
jgi:hypothetical protein